MLWNPICSLNSSKGDAQCSMSREGVATLSKREVKDEEKVCSLWCFPRWGMWCRLPQLRFWQQGTPERCGNPCNVQLSGDRVALRR